jgi:hypothetical protein
MSNSPIPFRSHALAEALAEVRTHDQVLRYSRVGVGRRHALVLARDDRGALWPTLMESLPRHARVLTPMIRAASGELSAWLGDFLEGVGVEHVVLLAVEELCLPALEFALAHPEQVDRMLLVVAGRSAASALDGALTSMGARIPLLVVRRGLPDDEALAMVMRFLLED